MTFQIITDSSCSIDKDKVKQYDIDVISLTYHIDNEDYPCFDENNEPDFRDFYDRLRQGSMATTSCPSIYEAQTHLEKYLKEGKDLLYIGFSTGLSGTYNAVCQAADLIKDNYQNRKIICIDTLAASLGQGLLVHYACKLRDEGKSIEEVAAWLEENKLHLAHWFTVDDLMFLFRGGRVSKTSAWAGMLLSIKPVMHMDNDGHLIPLEKVRGRNKALNALIKHMEQSAIQPISEQTVFISHGDCIEDANYVAEEIKNRFGVKDIYINYVDPVIGCHSGPGTLALFFLADQR
ncbi:MAG: DegV family protein [Eggerthellaceae bacterium]|nr:DegV family protein [Eggerthellaceae bacterium]